MNGGGLGAAMCRTTKTMLAERLLLGLCVCVFLETTHSVCRVQRWEYLHENAGSFGLQPKTINAERGLCGTVGVIFLGNTESMCRFKHGTTCRGNMCFLETTHSVRHKHCCHGALWDRGCCIPGKHSLYLQGSNMGLHTGGTCVSSKPHTLCAGFKGGTTCFFSKNTNIADMELCGIVGVVFLENTHCICRVQTWDYMQGNTSAAIRLENRALCQSSSPGLSLSLCCLCVSVSVSLSLSLSLSLCLCLYPPPQSLPSLFLCFSLSLFLSFSLSLCLSLFVSVSLSMSLSLSQCLSLSGYLLLFCHSQSLSLSLWLSLSLSG